jgi:hypothetical protein
MVYIPEDLHRWLKAKAALQGTTLSAVIEAAARDAYPEAPSGASRAMENLAVYGTPSRPRRRSSRGAT